MYSCKRYNDDSDDDNEDDDDDDDDDDYDLAAWDDLVHVFPLSVEGKGHQYGLVPSSCKMGLSPRCPSNNSKKIIIWIC